MEKAGQECKPWAEDTSAKYECLIIPLAWLCQPKSSVEKTEQECEPRSKDMEPIWKAKYDCLIESYMWPFRLFQLMFYLGVVTLLAGFLPLILYLMTKYGILEDITTDLSASGFLFSSTGSLGMLFM